MSNFFLTVLSFRFILFTFTQDTLDKFESSASQTQKEKFEGDLKKEIKKLQRLRDQIKTWLTANEVKDKRPLLDARKEIEQDMERFKVIEKETKTKAYSKEGLLSTDAKKDPLQKEKEELDEWLKQCISSLNTCMEKYEFEIESLTNNNKKKRVDKDTALAIEEKRQRLDNCSFHVEKLETVMRLLDNERLDCAILRSIKDPIEYVIQCSDDATSLDYKNMYDDLRLDEIGDTTGISAAAGAPTASLENEASLALTSASTTVNHRAPSDDAGSSTSTQTNNTDSSGTHPTSSTSSNASSRERTKSDDKTTTLGHVSASSTSTPLKPSSGVSGSSSKHKSCNIANQTAPPALMSQVVAGTPNKANRSFGLSAANGVLHALTSGDNCAVKGVSQNLLDIPTEFANRTTKLELISRTVSEKHCSSAVLSSTENRSKLSPSETVVDPLVLAESSTAFLVSSCCVPSYVSSTTLNSFPSTTKAGFAAVVGSQAVVSLCVSSSGPLPSVAACSSGPTAVSSGLLSVSTQSVSYTPNSLSISPASSLPSTGCVSSSGFLSSAQTLLGGNTESQPLNTCMGLDTTLSSSLASKLHSVAIAAGLSSVIQAASAQNQQHMTMDKQLPGLPASLYAQASRVQSCIQMHPRDAAAPFRNRNLDKSKGPIPQELLLQIQALENGYRKLPHPCDTEKSRMIVYKNCVNGPSYYPREPLPGTDTEEYYMQLDAQTLFFIFYYFEGTRAQYFSAKALKRMSWRFHTKYMMWFQRHEEPKQITDEYESGSYIYYDFKTMSQRKKEEFVFQYSFLEDKDF